MGAWLSADKSQLVVEAAFPDALVTGNGAPVRVFSTFAAAGGVLNVTVAAVNKSGTRLPEALYATVRVDGTTDYILDIMGDTVPATNGTLMHAARGQRGINEYITAGRLRVRSLDWLVD